MQRKKKKQNQTEAKISVKQLRKDSFRKPTLNEDGNFVSGEFNTTPFQSLFEEEEE